MKRKAIVLVTRKLPAAVEARLSRDFEPRLNADDRVYGSDEIVALAQGADARATRSPFASKTPTFVALVPKSIPRKVSMAGLSPAKPEGRVPGIGPRHPSASWRGFVAVDHLTSSLFVGHATVGQTSEQGKRITVRLVLPNFHQARQLGDLV